MLPALFSSGCYTKYHRLCDLQNTEIYFSQFWRLGSPRSESRHRHILVRAFFLGHSWHLLAISSRGGRGMGTLWGTFDKGTNPIPGGSSLMA